MIRVVLSALAVLAGALAVPVHAHQHETHAAAPLPAHEHGHAELLVALEGGLLELELRLPGMDAVGFERPPANEAERDAMAGVLAALEGAAWLSFPLEAACTLEEARFHTHGFGEAEEAKHDSGEDHGHEHDHAHHEGHAEFHGKLRYACLAPERLAAFTVDLGSRFAGLQKVRVTVLGPGGQTMLALDGGRGTVPLAGR